jgi:hypothetical protein
MNPGLSWAFNNSLSNYKTKIKLKRDIHTKSNSYED